MNAEKVNSAARFQLYTITIGVKMMLVPLGKLQHRSRLSVRASTIVRIFRTNLVPIVICWSLQRTHIREHHVFISLRYTGIKKTLSQMDFTSMITLTG